jgi:hypothetical protein
MSSPSPPPLSAAALRARRRRVARIAKRLGFVGRVEYRHVYSRTGGARYGLGVTEEQDLLTVYVEAFERDADPSDFSLNAILAHERGHQIAVRHPGIVALLAGRINDEAEEIVASVLGAIICRNRRDENTLMSKATVELMNYGQPPRVVTQRVEDLRRLLEAHL